MKRFSNSCFDINFKIKSKTDSENTVKSQVNEEQDDDQSDENIDQMSQEQIIGYQSGLQTESESGPIEEPDLYFQAAIDEALKQKGAQEQAKKDIEKVIPNENFKIVK